VSWTQEVPQTSLDFIHSFGIPKTASVIDVGGGDSKLADHLLDEGFRDITVLDISAKAIERAKARLGERAAMVNWIVSDITAFRPERRYDVWHDRAAFHFLTTASQIEQYLAIAQMATKGYMTIGTFSEEGPQKCSGLNIKQYNEVELESILSKGFSKMGCITEDHITPFNTKQNFLFCSFRSRLN
jgi:predicted TPR repeat methyltransferase